jgi:hypothetical protein
MPLGMRIASSAETSASAIDARACAGPERPTRVTTGASSWIVPHASHDGQRPSHLGVCSPQAVQVNRVAVRARVGG